MSSYLIIVYVPDTHTETVKKAIFATGAGQYKQYKDACWQTSGRGQFTPMDEAKPYIGQKNKLETVSELKIEIMCQESHLKDAIKALVSSHPYEEPAYHIIKRIDL